MAYALLKATMCLNWKTSNIWAESQWEIAKQISDRQTTKQKDKHENTFTRTGHNKCKLCLTHIHAQIRTHTPLSFKLIKYAINFLTGIEAYLNQLPLSSPFLPSFLPILKLTPHHSRKANSPLLLAQVQLICNSNCFSNSSIDFSSLICVSLPFLHSLCSYLYLTLLFALQWRQLI